MRLLLSLAVLATAYSHPQYAPQVEQTSHQATGYPSCGVDQDCVDLNQCVDGYIDTTGTGSIDLRGGPKKTAEQLGYTLCGLSGVSVQVCCGIPLNDYNGGVQVVSGGSHGGSAVGGGYVDETVGAIGVGSAGVGGDGYVDGTIGGIHSAAGGVGHGVVGQVGHGVVGQVGHGVVGHGAGGQVGHGAGGVGQVGVGGGGGYVDGAVGGGIVSGGVVGVGGDGYVDGTIGGGVVGGGIVGVGGDGYVDGSVGSGVSGGLSGPPYPACSAGLLCVEEATCNLYTGFIGDRIPLYEGQPFIEYKHCTTEYLPVGICCQEDPSKIPGPGDGGYVEPVDIHGGAVGGGVVVGGGSHAGIGVGSGHVAGGGVVGSGGYVDGQVGIEGVVGSGHIAGGSGHIAGGGVGSGHIAGGSGHITGGGVVGVPHDAGVGVGSGGYVDGSSGVGGGFVEQTGAIGSTQCGVYEECVLKEYCEKGIIVTDGSGLIDLRNPYKYKSCVDPEYPSSPAVCCRPDTAPLVESSCPNFETCTEYQFCSPEGFVSQDPYSPQYSSGTECYLQPGLSALTGVCCKPTCPVDASCIPESLCFGDIQDVSGVFGPYNPSGSWAKCSLIGESEPGVCCKNPVPVEPTPAKCGVSQYAQSNSLKTRYKTPSITKLEADFGEFPWQAIVFFSNYTFRCGASIITDKHLITAAHCVRDLTAYDLKIRVGEWQVNTFTEPYPYHDYNVASITFHPKYKRGPEHNNIAIIELADPLTLAYNVNTVCLPQDSYTFAPGTRCFVSGWGKDSFVGTYQHILKKVDVPLVEHQYCQTLLRKTRLGRYFRLHSGFLCAGGEEGKDACTGDGGGPLVCLDNNNQYVLVGVTSWGIGCAVKDVPGVYADVSKYTDFILGVIGGTAGTQYGK